VPVPAVQNPDPAPVFPRQIHVPQVSTNKFFETTRFLTYITFKILS
jgi:hypothetical protein